MKKIIAVAAALALAAGGAFAEVNFTGLVDVGINVVQGGNEDGETGPLNSDGEPGSLVVGRGLSAQGLFYLDIETDTNVGTFGAWTRLAGNFASPSFMIDYGAVWWQPNEMVWLGMGNALDNWIWPSGEMSAHKYGGWGGVGLHVTEYSGGIRGGEAVSIHLPYIQGFDSGLGVQITPMGDLLNIGIGLPYKWGITQADSNTAPELVDDVLRGVYFHTFLDLDFGRVGVGYVGGSKDPRTTGEGEEEITLGTDTDLGAIHAFFQSSALVDGLNLRAGVRFGLPGTFEDESTEKTTGWSDLAIGLGAQYVMGAFSVRFNGTAQFLIGGDDDAATYLPVEGAGYPTRLSFELAPSYDITENVAAVLYTGLGVDIAGSEVSEDIPAKIWWAVNPYVAVNIGATQRFFAGVHLYGNNGADNAIVNGSREKAELNWSIPVGIRVNF